MSAKIQQPQYHKIKFLFSKATYCRTPQSSTQNAQLPSRSSTVVWKPYNWYVLCFIVLFCTYLYCSNYATSCTFQLLFMIKLKISCSVNDLTTVNQTVPVSKCTGHCAEARSRAFQSSEIRDSEVVVSPWTAPWLVHYHVTARRHCRHFSTRRRAEQTTR